MTIVAVSMRSESGDDYLSLFTDADGPVEFADRMEEQYSEELSYLYIQCICTNDGTERSFHNELQSRIESAAQMRDSVYD